MNPKLISLGYSVPPNSYTTDQIFEATGYPQAYKRVFRESSIEKRHFVVPLDRLGDLSFQEQQELYRPGAVDLSKQAIYKCLDGRDIEDIGLLTYVSCTGFAPGPTVGHYLLRDMGFLQSTYVTNIISQGCEGAFPGLKRAYDYVVASGKAALTVCCELCSLTYFPDRGERPDPENNLELLRSYAIFGDGASCALVGYDDNPRHPIIVDFEVYVDPEYMEALGYTWRDGRLRVHLSRNVPELAAKVAAPAVRGLLERHHLQVTDIQCWIIHAAGLQVLNNIRDALGLDDKALIWSRETLRRYGNLSSATIGVSAKIMMEEGHITPGDWVIMATVGPGMSGGACLLRFP